MTSPSSRRAHVIGMGLIGASVAMALRECGWDITGSDLDTNVEEAASRRGLISSNVLGESHDLVVVATPAGSVAEVANGVLARIANRELIVTDVAGVKSSIVHDVLGPRFLGGHPMAGSELRGLAGARADLFQGCTWVLTPTEVTSPTTYSTLHGIWREVGANVVAVAPDDHDRLVAVASHVPHLVAGALMNEASRVAEQDAVLLQLAAGGFRDMTRVAAGDPTIWPDVLFENQAAIVQSLRALETRLAALREALESEGRDEISENLRTASIARRQLPGRALSSENLAFLRVKVSDQPGALAAVTVAASETLVNIYDIEIAHSIEGSGGVLLLAIDAQQVEHFLVELTSRGFQAVREQ